MQEVLDMRRGTEVAAQGNAENYHSVIWSLWSALISRLF